MSLMTAVQRRAYLDALGLDRDAVDQVAVIDGKPMPLVAALLAIAKAAP